MNKWKKLCRIVAPDPSIPWMARFTGASFAVPINDGPLFDIYVTGRDSQNRSHIGKININLESPSSSLKIIPKPIFSPGELGAFDENGVSYPAIIEHNHYLYMYYVGWMPTVLAPFQNHTGLAHSPIGKDKFERVSRAPILPRTDEEPFGTGSVSVMKEGKRWRLWYTVWLRWGSEPGEEKHYYVIRHAESTDGVHWRREPHICINFKNNTEYAIATPSVIKIHDTYHMWFSYRGEQYRIGYAHSQDGIHWTRQDELAGIDVCETGWDAKAISYPHVFQYKNWLYMLYCGNEYGKEGLGLAMRKI